MEFKKFLEEKRLNNKLQLKKSEVFSKIGEFPEVGTNRIIELLQHKITKKIIINLKLNNGKCKI